MGKLGRGRRLCNVLLLWDVFQGKWAHNDLRAGAGLLPGVLLSSLVETFLLGTGDSEMLPYSLWGARLDCCLRSAYDQGPNPKELSQQGTEEQRESALLLKCGQGLEAANEKMTLSPWAAVASL